MDFNPEANHDEECLSLYRMLMHTDYFWITRKFMSRAYSNPDFKRRYIYCFLINTC
jgi:hypothetical protein